MEWKDIELSDKKWMDPLLKVSGYQGCDYTFGNLYIWKDLYRQQVASAEGMVFVRSRKPGTEEYAYLYPAGEGDMIKAVQILLEDAKGLGVPLVLRGMGKAEADSLKKDFPGVFQTENVRDQWDYLYFVEDLANLAGKNITKREIILPDLRPVKTGDLKRSRKKTWKIAVLCAGHGTKSIWPMVIYRLWQTEAW